MDKNALHIKIRVVQYTRQSKIDEKYLYLEVHIKMYKVVLLETNVALMEQLHTALVESKEFSVVHAGDDGDRGLREIVQSNPDLVVTSVFLKGLDGNGIIRGVKEHGLQSKVVVTGIPSDDLIEKVMRAGASYYLIKPISAQTAVERFKELLKENKTEERTITVSKRKGISLEEKISEIFMAIGIPPHIKGYGYLRDAVKMTVEKPYVINSVTKELYPTVAKKYETTASKVERAIRHAIEVAWNRKRIEAINAIFGARIYLGSEKPTNSEFVALVADKLILESMG